MPPRVSTAFIYGFFRRDFGAAGLYDIKDSMTASQLVIAAVTLTLFMPCVAQVLVMARERGARTAFAIAAVIFPFAFLVGGLLRLAYGAAALWL